jgi:uncharacterized protein YeaC (DUF1315 family)
MTERRFADAARALTPELHLTFKKAIEIGKWPDGRTVTPEQRELCMEAILEWEAQHLSETDRVGYIDRGKKKDGELCDDEPEQQNILTWKDQ